MRVQKMTAIVLLGALLLVPGGALAQKDREGSKDHPLVGRYAGSFIGLYEAKDFDEYTLPLGKIVYGPKWTNSKKLEGKVTRITYVAPQTASTLAIQRSYEAALKKAAFEVVFTAGDAELFGSTYRDWYNQTNPYPDLSTSRSYWLGFQSQRYLAARLARAEGDVYVAVYAAMGNATYSQNPTVQVDVIEVKALESGLVSAKVMAESLEQTGRVAIYSIYFDTGKADIKPESEPTLKEIATLLQQNAKLNLYVVGHTDNMGTLPYNMDLSQRRAEAVVKALSVKSGITAQRLRSAGVGPLAPVAPNTSDDGRAKNRRVELVAQ